MLIWYFALIGTDAQSEFSDYSVSTSVCSSMIPHPDSMAYHTEVTRMNESRIRQLRQDLGGSVTPSKELEAKSQSGLFRLHSIWHVKLLYS